MIRIVLDTNVIISALTANKPTPPLDILILIQNKKIIHATSAEILEEVEEVMNREKLVKRHKLLKEQVHNLIINFAQASYLTAGKISITVVKDDPDDDKFVDCAVESNAERIVSGDNHLLTLKEYKNIKIMTPGDFIKEFRR